MTEPCEVCAGFGLTRDAHPLVPDPAACTHCGYNPPHPDYAGLCLACSVPQLCCGEPLASCRCSDGDDRPDATDTYGWTPVQTIETKGGLL